MNVESTYEPRAAVHAALGDPARLAIVDALALTDASPSELGRALGMPSNLLAHHLGVLQQAKVIVRGRSEADRRRTYVGLAAAAIPYAVAEDVPEVLRRIVFICTHNSARSPLAAALWANRSDVPATSAGTHPASHVHREAVAAARRHGLELRHARTAHVRDVLRTGDLVVAVCDGAYEELAGREFAQLHWSVPDPARGRTADAFDRAFESLDERVERLVTAVERRQRCDRTQPDPRAEHGARVGSEPARR